MELGYLAIFTALAAIVMINMLADRHDAREEARRKNKFIQKILNAYNKENNENK